jgi:HK97 family phage portal protein
MIWPFSLLRKENPVNKSIIALYGGSSTIWTPDDFRSLSIAGYETCVAVFACVKLIASTASRVPWSVGRMDANGDMKDFDRHPLLDLLNHPNEVEGGAIFTEKTLSYLLLNGNSYVLGVRGLPSQPPRFLYSLRPDRMVIKPDKSGQFLVSGYTYNPGASEQNFLATDIMHLMEFHPTDDFYGLSRLKVAKKKFDISNKADDWNANLLQNDMKSPGIVTARSVIDLDKFKDKWRENYQGAANAGKPIVLSGEDIKWQSLSLTPKDVDWLNGQKFTMRQICSIFGVDSCLVGDMEYATYSNKQEARKGLYMEVVLPLMDLLRDEYQRWLVPYYGKDIILNYDRDKIEELQEDREKQYTYLKTASWLTINEKRLATGYDERPDGDIYDKPAPPAFGNPGAQEPPPPPPKKMARKSIWREPDNAKALWNAFEQRARTREKTFLELATTYLEGQKGRIVEKIKGDSLSALHVGSLFNQSEETQEYVKHFTPWYRDHFSRAVSAGKRASKGEIFEDGEFKASWTINMTPAQEAKLRDMVFNSGTKVNKTTIQKIYDELLAAQNSNMTVSEFERALSDKITELTRGRASNWAETESCKVDNYGQLEGMRETEFVTGKGWLCSLLPTSRPDHVEAHLQEVGLDESFNIGGEAMDCPGDPKGTPDEVCRCRCSLYPVTD